VDANHDPETAPAGGRKGRAKPGAARTKPGRPADPAKQAQIVEAATALFLDRGLKATTMEAVARRAGVSKITVYARFASKLDLFRAIIDGLAGRILAELEEVAPGDLPPEEALRRVGRTYLDLALAAPSLALHRLVIGEAAHLEGLGALIYEAGPARIVGALAAYLERHPRVDVAEPLLAAEQFLGAVLGHAQLSLLLGAAEPGRLRAEAAARVDHAVATFCRGAVAPRRG
jgi:TetR/AcrR family transcriptional regulator, mexJK operon transcriptional repressor